jgi:ATP-dependent RNA helicase DeaD/ATP-dependent RNA helicase RhlE
VSPEVEQSLAARSILNPFKIQELVVPEALRGSDILAKSPTGSVKTLAFGLPIVERTSRDGRTPSVLILVPTRELAQQVAEELTLLGKPKGLKVAVVYGGAPLPAQANRAKVAHIVVATPGRIWDLVERKLVKLDGVSTLVLDEADRMLDMGFKPQVDKLMRRVPKDRQTMFFSATLDGEIGELASQYTHMPARFEGDLPLDRRQGEVEHRFVPVTADTKVETLVELLRSESGQTLVFVRTKRGADRLAAKLSRQDVQAVAMHGDLTQRAREKALKQFEQGQVTTLVATDVAARGLDLDAITHVVNFDPPEDGKGYTHRVGRTGRAGRAGVGVTLVLPEQQGDVSRVAKLSGHGETWAETGMREAAPKLVYQSRRKNSKWGPVRARRKI